MGVPVYFHYCGGELEKVDFITKGNSCCDDQESDIPEENNGCCKDETLVLQGAKDALIKKDDRVLQQSLLSWHAVNLYYSTPLVAQNHVSIPTGFSPPVPLHQQKLISTFIFRI